MAYAVHFVARCHVLTWAHHSVSHPTATLTASVYMETPPAGKAPFQLFALLGRIEENLKSVSQEVQGRNSCPFHWNGLNNLQARFNTTSSDEKSFQA